MFTWAPSASRGHGTPQWRVTGDPSGPAHLPRHLSVCSRPAVMVERRVNAEGGRGSSGDQSISPGQMHAAP